MARAHYVYLVTNRETRIPLAAFTVKHECVSWLQKESRTHNLTGWAVFRILDGGEALSGPACAALFLDLNA